MVCGYGFGFCCLHLDNRFGFELGLCGCDWVWFRVCVWGIAFGFVLGSLRLGMGFLFWFASGFGFGGFGFCVWVLLCSLGFEFGWIWAL